MRRALRWLFSTFGLAACSLLAGADHVEVPREGARSNVEFAGCSAVLRGPVCEFGEGGEINLWAKAPEGARVFVSIAGRSLALHEKTFCQGGARMRLKLPEEARELVVTIEQGGARERHRVLVRPYKKEATLEGAEALRKSGKIDDASALLSRATKVERSRVTRARLLSKLARLDLARGETAIAISHLDEAIAMHQADGRISEEAEDRMTLVYTHVFHGRSFPAARSALEALAPLEAEYPEGRAMVAYYGALFASETGDFRSALALLRAAAETVERLGMEKLGLEVKQLHADVLQRMGRAREAEALLAVAERAAPPQKAPCRRASLLNDIGYNALLVAQASGGDEKRLEASVSALRRALELYAEGGPCPKPRNRANALTNLALASLYRGSTEDARHFVEEARRAFPAADTRMTTEWGDIEGRISLAEGSADVALSVYEDSYADATRAAEPEGLFVAELGRARALAALGSTKEADLAYGRAEGLSRERSLLVPLGEGRATFLGRFEEGAEEHVELLLDVDPGAALAAARRARGQMLSTLQWSDRLPPPGSAARARWEDVLSTYRRDRQRMDTLAQEDWKLAADELVGVVAARRARGAELEAMLDEALVSIGVPDADSPGVLPEPREGELVLAYFRLRKGLAGFAWTREGVFARRLGRVTGAMRPEELAAALLGPFEARIEQARRIRVVGQGELDRIDVHALPWRGAPLLARVPVVYGVDLPVRGALQDEPVAKEPGGALVVGDPRGDLPAARREAESVASRLAQRGVFPRRLSRKEATRGALRDALEDPQTSLFHYAGHGFFGGRDGWESGLPLAGGADFSVGDVLSLVRVPRNVVLSGCETGRTEIDVPVQGLGLGQAFVVAGAASVVATTRPVDDRLAELVMVGFYGAEGDGAPLDVAEALRRAVLRAAREAPSSDWSSFRVFVP